jgi:hypothetical protein
MVSDHKDEIKLLKDKEKDLRDTIRNLDKDILVGCVGGWVVLCWWVVWVDGWMVGWVVWVGGWVGGLCGWVVGWMVLRVGGWVGRCMGWWKGRCVRH